MTERRCPTTEEVQAMIDASGGGGASFAVPYAEAFSGSSPTSWTDLDLHDIVGVNKAWVLLKISAGSDMDAVAVRKKGDTDEFWHTAVDASTYGCSLVHHDSTAVPVLSTITDENGIIQWKCEKSANDCIVTVMAYIK